MHTHAAKSSHFKFMQSQSVNTIPSILTLEKTLGKNNFFFFLLTNVELVYIYKNIQLFPRNMIFSQYLKQKVQQRSSVLLLLFNTNRPSVLPKSGCLLQTATRKNPWLEQCMNDTVC